jgi:Cu/Ag efflux protein CusF
MRAPGDTSVHMCNEIPDRRHKSSLLTQIGHQYILELEHFSASGVVSQLNPLGRCAMRTAGVTVVTVIALGLSGTAYAQEAMKGEVATVDEASGKIGIKLNGTVGSGDATAPTQFKVQDGLLFNAVKPGDKVSFTAENVGGVMTIKKLTKE